MRNFRLVNVKLVLAYHLAQPIAFLPNWYPSELSVSLTFITQSWGTSFGFVNGTGSEPREKHDTENSEAKLSIHCYPSPRLERSPIVQPDPGWHLL